MTDKAPQGREQVMKMTVNVDCTADEARQFLGLPDLKPMQEAVLAKIEQQMLAAVDTSSPEAMLRAWMPFVPQSAEQLQALMANFYKSAFGKS
jgi:hypothetical protein